MIQGPGLRCRGHRLYCPPVGREEFCTLPQCAPSTSDTSPATHRDGPLAGFDRGWLLLQKVPLGEPGEAPAVIDLVLLHARRGVALLEAPPRWTPDAPQWLRRRLEQARFGAIFPGHLPVLHLQLLRGALAELPQVLAAGFSAAQPLDLPGGDAWIQVVRRALTAGQESGREGPAPAPWPAARLVAAVGLGLAVGIGFVLVATHRPATMAELAEPASALAGVQDTPALPAESRPPPMPDLAKPALLRLATDVKAPEFTATPPRPGEPAGLPPAAPDPAWSALLRGIVAGVLPSLPKAQQDAVHSGAVGREVPDMPSDLGALSPRPLPPVPAAIPEPGPAVRGVPPARLGPAPEIPASGPQRGAEHAAAASDVVRPATFRPQAATASSPGVGRTGADAAGPGTARAGAAASPASLAASPAGSATLPPGAGEPAQIAALMRRGDALLAIGDVSGARRFYARAAEAGSPEGAQAAGRSYDPAELTRLGLHGVHPDPATATTWYRHAEALAAMTARR